MDVHEPERLHPGHVRRPVVHAAVHLVAAAVQEVRLAAAHVHLARLLPAEQGAVELERGDVVRGHELVPREVAYIGLLPFGGFDLDRLVHAEDGALRILDHREASGAGDVVGAVHDPAA